MWQLTDGLAEGRLRDIPGNHEEASLKQQVLSYNGRPGPPGQIGGSSFKEEGGMTPGSKCGCRKEPTQRQSEPMQGHWAWWTLSISKMSNSRRLILKIEQYHWRKPARLLSNVKESSVAAGSDA